MQTKIIGVIGYSDNSCKTDYAATKVAQAIATAAAHLGCEFKGDTTPNPDNEPTICSGLTDLGIPALAYKFAKRLGLRTIGIACSKATEHSCFPVDEKIIVGDDWGAESETFLKKIDALVRIGGGKQSETEWQVFGMLYPDKFKIYVPLTRDGKET